jgi:CheY-like chemotaxis protein
MPHVPPIRLLVVDDHAAFRQTVRQMFDALDADVTEAGSGEDAVELYTRLRPDWVVMDLRMPGMGGIKAAEAIRKSDPQARIIIISQFTDPELRKQAQEVGAVDFVDKENISLLTGVVCPREQHNPGKSEL